MSYGDAFETYLAEIRRHPLLDRAEEAELARRVRDGDELALERLVNANLRFVVSVARRYAGHGVPLDELVNEGNVGLIHAARRFDESRGVRFVSYAVWWIRRAVIAALSRDARIVHVPSGRLDDARRVAAAGRRLSQRMGRGAHPHEVAAELGVSAGAVREALALRSRDVSLDAPADAGEGTPLLEFIPDASDADPSARVDGEALVGALRHGLLRLPELEAEVVRRYYGLDGAEPETLTEIAVSLGVSRERAGSIRDRALARLRLGALGRDLLTFHAH
ncbi:MAG: sigma-70 family RNA polymerase sigma factor [Gemmatimonadota bacterium]